LDVSPESGEQDERRRFTRFEFDARTELSQGGDSWPVELIDISLKGLLAKAPEGLTIKIGDSFTAVVYLAGDEVKITLPVTLVHVEDGCLGFHCGMLELDSVAHLRRLAELNLGDESLLDRELSQLVQAAD
jgi:hypothetical protein